MTQIINLITFLKEWFFPSDRMERRKSRSSFRGLMFTTCLAASLIVNYNLLSNIFTASSQTVKLKTELQELRPMAEKARELEKTNEVLRLTLFVLAPDKFPLTMGKGQAPNNPPLPVKPKALPVGPSPRTHNKEDPIKGKTPSAGN